MFLNCRENRTLIGEGINIGGALRNGGLRPEFEDDVVLGLEVDSLNEVKLEFKLEAELSTPELTSMYLQRNSYTVSYKDRNKIKYEQVEVFVQASSPRNNPVQYAAVILPLLKQT